MSHTRSFPSCAAPRCALVVAIVLTLAACGTRKPAPPPSADRLAAMATALAVQEQRLAVLASDTSDDSPIVTRVVFNRGMYKPGIERLRVVRRQNTVNNVAAQVALNIALIALTRGAAVQGFSKDELAGDAMPELANDPVSANPASQDVANGLGRMATRFYARRAIEAVAVAKTDGSTPEEIADASQIPKDLGTALNPTGWQLVYENIASGDDLYRLKFGAQLGRTFKGPVVCGYVSEPLGWAAWQVDGWQHLREERAKAVTRCTTDLGAYIAANW
ncbi:hypothetical protein [Variovorax sp. RTB1]|uniref:hypothetical protein n=1 Tax=Variovorax sp. RTB1 TaxID=3048631 RepID=UPI002B2377A5|nr:hypothetical protein [Variovorax sp. RTB1]